MNEANNAELFACNFADIDYVCVPRMYRKLSTPRMLVMEFVESFKLTDVKCIESLGLDRKVLAKRVVDTFLCQIVETAYFHAKPHSGKLWKMKGLGTIRFEAGTGGKYVKGIPLQQQQCSSRSKIYLKASNQSIMMVMHQEAPVDAMLAQALENQQKQ